MLTVLIATFNGAETLPTTLESFTRLELPEGGWKLIVVDNASTDDSAQILERYKGRLPLQVLHQPRPGKNAALNMALPHVDGELIVFTDDDVVPGRDWLRRLQEAAAAHPDFAIFGGRIIPRWPKQPSDWFLEEVPLAMAYAVTTPEWTDGPISAGNVWGGNMCVRKRVFDSGGFRFNEVVGPAAGNYIMGGETEFTMHAERAGFKCWHVPAAVVEHLVRDYQLEPRWVISRAFREGRSAGFRVMQNPAEKDAGPVSLIFGFPRWRVRRLIESSILALLYLLLGMKRRWFHHAYIASFEKGVLYELRRQRRVNGVNIKGLS